MRGGFFGESAEKNIKTVLMTFKKFYIYGVNNLMLVTFHVTGNTEYIA
jgi:hypothetical protein